MRAFAWGLGLALCMQGQAHAALEDWWLHGQTALSFVHPEEPDPIYEQASDAKGLMKRVLVGFGASRPLKGDWWIGGRVSSWRSERAGREVRRWYGETWRESFWRGSLLVDYRPDWKWPLVFHGELGAEIGGYQDQMFSDCCINMTVGPFKRVWHPVLEAGAGWSFLLGDDWSLEPGIALGYSGHAEAGVFLLWAYHLK